MTHFKGTVLELKRNQSIVITDVCDFLIIKRSPGMFIGQEIEFQKSDINTTWKKYAKYLALVASIFIIALTFAFYNQFLTPNTVYAFVDVDINPSLEFAIDKDTRVLDIKALNRDAETLLKKLKLNNLPMKQAIIEVVKESKQLGFIKLNKRNSVLVSASLGSMKQYTSNKSDDKELNKFLADISSTAIDLGSEKITPKVLKVTPKERIMAIESKISMGRYVMYNKIKEKNANITIEEVMTFSVSDMIDKALVSSSKASVTEGNNHNQNGVNEADNTNKNSKKDRVDNGNIINENKIDNKDKKEDKLDNHKESSNKEGVKDIEGSIGQNSTVDPVDKSEDALGKGASDDNKGNTDQITTTDPSDKGKDGTGKGASDDNKSSTDQITTTNPSDKGKDGTGKGASDDNKSSTDQITTTNPSDKGKDDSGKGAPGDNKSSTDQITTTDPSDKGKDDSGKGAPGDKKGNTDQNTTVDPPDKSKDDSGKGAPGDKK